MHKTVQIDTPDRLDDDIEDFQLDCLDDEKNYTAARIKLCRDPEDDQPVLVYNQQLTRHFRDGEDPFGRRERIKVFTPSNLSAIADTTLEHKFKDTLLAHKDRIRNYSPLSDIHSDEMNLFMDENTATFLADIGVNVDGLGEDFTGIESVSADPFMDEISEDADRLKRQLAELRQHLRTLQQQMADEFEEYTDPDSLTETQFEERLARESMPDSYIQTYLKLKEQIAELEAQLGELSQAVFSETARRIRLPSTLEERQNDLLKL